MRSNQITTITKQIFAKFDRLANKFDDLIFAFDLFVWAVPYFKKKAQVFPYDLILFTNKQFILFELRVPVIWVNHWIICTYSPAWVLSNIFISRFLNMKYSCLVLIYFFPSFRNKDTSFRRFNTWVFEIAFLPLVYFKYT